MAAPHCKVVQGHKNCPVKSEPKMAVFPVLQRLNVTFCFLTPKRCILDRSRVF